MKLFDFHCDTPFALEKHGEKLTTNNRHIALDKVEKYDTYGQLMAIFTQKSLPEEVAWGRFFVIREDFYSKMTEKTALCHTFADYEKAISEGKHPFFLAVEGGGLLCDKLERLTTLYEHDVRFLTLVWRDADCIGGAFNTDVGLTDFGREVVKKCFEMGIVVDLSHASDPMAEEVLTMAEAAGKAVIATHSDSRAVYAHPRNLPDDFAKRIAKLGGTVGISMAPQHLGVNDYANIDIICDHMLHYLEIGLEDSLTFGCDFDGLDTLPEGVEDVSKIIDIADALRKKDVSEEQIEKIFYKNAERFLKENF